jgi:lipopolysaccharide export LptBFGC system permease protein LptF
MKPSSLPHRRPTHPSYQLHRRQVWTQILLPMVFVALVFVGIIVLTSMGAFQGNGDVERWAAISTIWLVMPVMVVGLIVLILLIGIIYLIIYVMNLIPPYSHQTQRIFYRIEGGAKRIGEMARKPVLLFQQIGVFIRDYLQKTREGM